MSGNRKIKVVSFLSAHKDVFASIASIVSIISLVVLVVSVIVGIRQFSLTRQAIQAQVIGNSLAHGREFHTELAENPRLAQRLFGADPEEVAATAFVQKLLNYFTEQYVYRQAQLIDDETWAIVRRDICQAYNSPGFRQIATQFTSRRDLPHGFNFLIEGCSNAP